MGDRIIFIFDERRSLFGELIDEAIAFDQVS
jgi:hypothetical protein